ncbi:MAG: hypothetical protein ACFFDT_19545 [Candidatus Hodarchaeota archaeon]
MQEDFFSILELSANDNFALVLVPIVALLGIIIYFMYLLSKQRKLRQLKESNMFVVRQYSQVLADRCRIKFRPFASQGVSSLSMSLAGSNILDLSGTLYLLNSETNTETSLRADTCALVNWNSGKFACFRISGIKSDNTILSMLGFKKWIKIGKPPMTILWIIIIGLSLYNMLLSIGMTEGYEPTFLVDTGMFGWYFSFFLLLMLYFVRQQVVQGFFGDAWVISSVRQDVILEKPKIATRIPDKLLKTNIEVYEIGFVYHDFIPPSEFYGKFTVKEKGHIYNAAGGLELHTNSYTITSRDIANQVNASLKQTVAELSSNMSNLSTSYEQLQRLLELKQIENSAMKDVLDSYKMEGVAEGLELQNQTLRGWGSKSAWDVLGSDKMLGVAKAGIPLAIFGVLALGFVNIVSNFLLNFTPDPGLVLIFIVGALLVLIIGAFLVLLTVKALIRGPFG